MKRFIGLAVGVTLAASLTACGDQSQTGLTATDLNPSSITGMSCARAQDVTAELNERLAAKPDSGKYRELVKLGLDPSDTDQVSKVRAALSAACDPQQTPTPAASDDPVVPQSDGPSASPSATGGTDTIRTRLPYKSWAQVVAAPPADLRARVRSAAHRTQFDWAQVRGWAENRAATDARILLVFGQDGGRLSTNDVNVARARANVSLDVPIVGVTSCEVINGTGVCPTSGTRVILAPINSDGMLTMGYGVMMRTGAPIIGYTGRIVYNP